MRGKAIFGTLGALVMAGAAHAGVKEVHVGVLAHNIQIIDGKNANKEDGPVVEAQLNFDSPHFLHWAGKPQPYVVASVNVAGDTSFGGAGLEWQVLLAQKWRLNAGIGYVIHDGELRDPYPSGSAQSAQFAEDHVLLGSRDLFRLSLGLSREFSEHWSGQLFYSHLSHGQILGHGRNQGMDQAGVRVGYSFHD